MGWGGGRGTTSTPELSRRNGESGEIKVEKAVRTEGGRERPLEMGRGSLSEVDQGMHGRKLAEVREVTL